MGSDFVQNKQDMPARDDGWGLSEARVKIICSEIARCVKNCNHRVLFPGFIPSRLLKIGGGDSETGCVDLRLLNRGEVILDSSWASPNGSVKYAALSYCWGPSADALWQCKTDRQSLQARQRGIAWAELTPVVRDAVIVARKLGLQYLWVDCFCIIQDDDLDWQNEASLMGLVYSNAYVTIANLSSSTCRRGFLGSSSIFPGLSYSAVEEPHGTNVATWAGETRRLARNRNYTYEFLSDWSQSGWSMRGWTFQETKLSTRLVYFGKSRIHFCCGSWLYTEGHSIRARFEPNIIDVATNAEDPGPIQKLVKFWRDALVPQFSRKRFTLPRDKLPAISGVAKLMGDVTGYEYAAGLWVPHLHTELFWFCEPAHFDFQNLLSALVPDDSGFIAPSWSWARFATTNSVKFCLEEWSTRDVVIEASFEASVELGGPNRYGQIRGGVLKMSTKVLDILPGDCTKLQTVRAAGVDFFLVDWLGRNQFEPNIDAELALIGRYTALLGYESQEETRFYGLIIYPWGDRHISNPAGLPGRYFRVGLFDIPASSEYGSAFWNTEPREIQII